jgi:hypothetical protein
MNVHKLLISILMLVSVLLSACASATATPSVPTATLPTILPTAVPPTVTPTVAPAHELTIFSSRIYKLPMSVSFDPAEWRILDDDPDLVTVQNKQKGWQFPLEIVTNAKLADPVDGHLIPFPDDFVSWIKSDPDFVAGEATEVMVGGIQGIQIDAKSITTKAKDYLYLTSGIVWNIPPSAIGRWILLNNVDGERVLITIVMEDANGFKDAAEQFQPIINSVVFTKP